MQAYILTLIVLLCSLHGLGQDAKNRVYISPDPMYKYNIDTAYTLLDNNNFAEAISFLRAALKITDKSYYSYLKLANALNKTAQTDLCFETLMGICNSHWNLLSGFIAKQESAVDFMFANLVKDKRWTTLTDCLRQKSEAHNNDIEAANRLIHESKYAEAIPHLLAALQVNDNTHLIEIQLATAYNKTGQSDLCFEELNKIAHNLEWMEDYLTTDTAPSFAFANLVHNQRYVHIKQYLDSATNEQYTGHNKALMLELKDMLRTDQLYRNKLGFTSGEPRKTNAAKDSLWRLQVNIDSVNLCKIIRIFDVYGYPGDSLVGGNYSKVGWIVIQHSDVKYQEKYLSMMKAAVEKKQMASAYLALLVDRIEMHNKRPQIYGTQVNCDIDDHCTVYKILDEAKVNKLRTDVGLGPLQDYLSGYGIIWKAPAAGK